MLETILRKRTAVAKHTFFENNDTDDKWYPNNADSKTENQSSLKREKMHLRSYDDEKETMMTND